MAFGNIGAVGTLPVPFGGGPPFGVPLFGTSMVAGVARRTGKFVIGYPAAENGIGLTGFLGAFDPTAAAADSGVFTTANPVGTNFHGLPVNFGPGRGRWRATDLMRLSIDIYDPADTVLFPDLHVALMRVENLADVNNNFSVDFVPGLAASVNNDAAAVTRWFGDLLIGIHNRGDSAGDEGTTGFSVRIAYDHSLPTGI